MIYHDAKLKWRKRENERLGAVADSYKRQIAHLETEARTLRRQRLALCILFTLTAGALLLCALELSGVR